VIPGLRLPAVPRVRHIPGTTVVVVLMALAGCSSTQGDSLQEFARWQSEARIQAATGRLSWTDFYSQSFDRLTAMAPSLQQDTRLENTVLLLSTARKYEAQELTAHQFAAERETIESRLMSRLR
jgi:tRNA isopentenyl-2-thiomethyl-A-37 hydroxylase MiaE